MYPLLLGNGETQWMQVKVKGVQLGSGQAKGAIIYHKPVNLHSTQPMTAEIILESMTEGFYLLDNHLKVIYMNEIAEELLLCNRRNATGRELFDLFPEVVDTTIHYNYRGASKEQTVIEFVDYYGPLDKWFQIKACPLKKDGLSVYFQDVSERIKTEVQLTEFAYYDFLTRLPNRKLTIQKIQSFL